MFLFQLSNYIHLKRRREENDLLLFSLSTLVTNKNSLWSSNSVLPALNAWCLCSYTVVVPQQSSKYFIWLSRILFSEELLFELREMGIGIYGTGGETADVGDLVRTIIVDSTVTCRMKRSDVINNANIKPGDVIVGLSSSGQATYEKSYNGGMGSNGLTSARHDVFAKSLSLKYPK